MRMIVLQTGLLFLVGAVVTLLLLLVVRRMPQARRFSASNDFTGSYIAATAAIYAVLLGFMVLAVWTRFDQAEGRVEEEAATIGTLARLAHALPGRPDAEIVIVRCQQYAESVASKEWVTMDRGEDSPDTHEALDNLWEAVLKMKVTSPQDTSLVSEAIGKMTELSRLRRLRLLGSRASIPSLLWALLIVGAVVTTGTSLMLGAPSFRQHAVYAVSLWLVISLSLAATAELATPFQGGVRIEPDAFQHAIAPSLLEGRRDVKPAR